MASLPRTVTSSHVSMTTLPTTVTSSIVSMISSPTTSMTSSSTTVTSSHLSMTSSPTTVMSSHLSMTSSPTTVTSSNLSMTSSPTTVTSSHTTPTSGTVMSEAVAAQSASSTNHIQNVLKEMNLEVVALKDLKKPTFCSLLSADITLKASHPSYIKQMKRIGQHVMTYLNTSGGMVIVRFRNNFTRKHADEWEVKVAQYLTPFITDSTYRQRIKINVNMVKGEAEIIIEKSEHLITMQSNLYVRASSSCHEVRDQNELWNVLHKAAGQLKAVTGRTWQGLSYGDTIPEDETFMLEFKCYQVSGADGLIRKIKADVIKGRDITAFERVILAFPQNIIGGRVIIGVREDILSGDKIIWGQELEQIDEEMFTEFLDTLLKQSSSGMFRIWREEGFQPKLGMEWHVKYHPISNPPHHKRRVLIEITIEHFPGGVFGEIPECMFHDDDGIIQAMLFEDWKKSIKDMHNMKVNKAELADVSPESKSMIRPVTIYLKDQSPGGPDDDVCIDLDEETQEHLARDMRIHHKSILPKKNSDHFSWSKSSKHWSNDTVSEQLSRSDLVNVLQGKLLRLESPMNVTPEKSAIARMLSGYNIDCLLDSIQKYFNNDEAAIFWSQKITDIFPIDGINSPPDHVSDILALSERTTLHFWTCCKSEAIVEAHKTYMFEAIRRLHKLMLETSLVICQDMDNFVSRISISGHVFCLDAGREVYEASQAAMDDATLPIKTVQLITAALLLTGKTQIRSRLGDELLISLTRDQMETIFNCAKAKVSIIQGPPGSGKTIMALYLCEMLMKQSGLTKEQISYICPNEELAVYVRGQDRCRVKSVSSGKMILSTIASAVKRGVKCFILDDVQVLEVKRRQWRKIFSLIYKMPYQEAQLIIFTDSTYQNFICQSAHKLGMAVEEYYAKHPLYSYYKSPPLCEMLRNSRKIFSYFQANVNDEYASTRLVCRHDVVGDDITVLYCPDMFLKSPDNPIVQVVGQLLKQDADTGYMYEPSDVAVLVDSGGKTRTKTATKTILGLLCKFLPTAKPQTAMDIPIKGVVVEELENYSGLDAKACICVLANRSTAKSKLDDYRFKLFVASRGVCRVTYMVHGEADSDVLNQMKFSEDLLWKEIAMGSLKRVLSMGEAVIDTKFDFAMLPNTQPWNMVMRDIITKKISAVLDNISDTAIDVWLARCYAFLCGSEFTVPWSYYIKQVNDWIDNVDIMELNTTSVNKKMETINNILPTEHTVDILKHYANRIKHRVAPLIENGGPKEAIWSIIKYGMSWESRDWIVSCRVNELFEAKLEEMLLEDQVTAAEDRVECWLSQCVPESFHSDIKSLYVATLLTKLCTECLGSADYKAVSDWTSANVPKAFQDNITCYTRMHLTDEVYRAVFQRHKEFAIENWLKQVPETFHKELRTEYKEAVSIQRNQLFGWRDKKYTKGGTRHRMKVVMVGDGAVGCSAIVVRVLKGQMLEEYVPTVFETWVHDVTVDGYDVEVAIWETAGQEDYDFLRPLSYPDTDVVLVVYSVSSSASAENVTEKWLPEIRQFVPKAPIILVATKIDERRNKSTLYSQLKHDDIHRSTYAGGVKLAVEIGARDYLECSSLTGEGTTQVFDSAARLYMLSR